jgi:CDP-diacylglycerol--glycerol-3-phosphate 3-phosphatidyltransferase
VIVVLFYLHSWWHDQAAGLMFALAGITDSIDGWLARRTGQVSPLGEFLDPVADKLIVAIALVLVVARDQHPYVVLPAIVIVGREIAISALREWMAEIGARRKVAVSALGKFKTIIQVVGIAMLLYREDLGILPIYRLGLVLTAIAAALTLWSMIWYLKAAWPDLTRDASA